MAYKKKYKQPIRYKTGRKPFEHQEQATEKECNVCHKVLPIEDFYRVLTTKDGRQAYCKHCKKKKEKRT